jgi:AmmeMemoRadiSam system protein B
MEKSNIRKPVVSGQFYPSSSHELNKQIEAFIDKKSEKQDVIGCVLPHAGYVYSGLVAGQTVSRINIKDKIILLGPNHTGYGSEFSIMAEGAWQTPLGEIKIDNLLASQILEHSPHLRDDYLAHAYEHSLEVELPFLQYFKSDFKMVPIAILSDDTDALKEIGKGIATVIEQSKIKDSTIIVASSDMTHYEPLAQAQKKDKEAMQAILELNEDKLMEKILKLRISMCGYAPVIAMLAAAKRLGAQRGTLIKYQTSGDVTGDIGSVVGYAGIIIY